MKNVLLVRLDPALEKRLGDEPEYMAALIAGDWPAAADVVHRVVGHTLTAAPVSVDELRWGGYFAVDEETREVVGSCAYKTPPNAEGSVEIAYFTYPEFEGRGYASAMAAKLVKLAAGSGSVRRVIAHTLPEMNASTSVLKKIGMISVGEVIDPDDGRVWRWSVEIGESQGRSQ